MLIFVNVMSFIIPSMPLWNDHHKNCRTSTHTIIDNERWYELSCTYQKNFSGVFRMKYLYRIFQKPKKKRDQKKVQN